MVGERLFGGGVHRIRLLLVGVEDVISLIRRVLEKGVVLEEYVEVVMEEVVEEGDGEMCQRFLLSSIVTSFLQVSVISVDMVCGLSRFSWSRERFTSVVDSVVLWLSQNANTTVSARES